VRSTRAHLFHLRDDKVTRLASYWSPERALADLGFEGQAPSKENVEVVCNATTAFDHAGG
jgi:hypothetical protein